LWRKKKYKKKIMEVNKVYNENCKELVRRMPDGFINCVVTSPPYYGLRDYGTGRWVGGDEHCDHIERFAKHGGERRNRDQSAQIFQARGICKKCGAVRIDEQFGLEETPEQYVENLVELFRDIRRALRDDGTVWLNLGDSYNGSGKAGNNPEYTKKHTAFGKIMENGYHGKPVFIKNLKQKDLIGIPWMVAFALRADGWYLRQDIIWHKPKPMPESVRDRCTKSHEYIFLLSKSHTYYYDANGIKENCSELNVKDFLHRKTKNNKGGCGGTYEEERPDLCRSRDDYMQKDFKRNKRSVWTVSTKPFKEAHFATFPEDLIVPCIRAGCPEGGIVYDPFMGSGTTAVVSHKLKRNWIGSELNPEYIKIIDKRMLPLVSQVEMF